MFFIAEVHPDKDGVGFIIPDLPGFVVHHETDSLNTGLKEAEDVLRDYLAAMIDSGQEIPAPRTIEAVMESAKDRNGYMPGFIAIRGLLPAGRTMKVTISMDEHSLAMVDAKAQRRGINRSAFLAEAARAFD